MDDNPAIWSPSDAISFGWDKVKTDLVGLCAPLLVVGIIQGIPSGIMGAVASSFEQEGEVGVGGAIRIVNQLVGLVISAYFTGGVMSFMLKAARGQPYSFGDVFSGGRYFVNMLIAMFIIQIASGVGFMLCIVPGVVIALGLSMTVPLIVDRELSAIDALKESWALTTGHKGNLFVFGLLGFCVILLGMLACCVGVIPAAAVIGLAQVYIYLALTENNPASPPAPTTF